MAKTKKSVSTNKNRKAKFEAQFLKTKKNLERKGKTNKKKKRI